MAEVPEVLVLGVVGLSVDLERNILCLGIGDLFLTGLKFPGSPRGDDLHVGSVCLDGELKTHLIVALAGAAVADGVGALCQRDFYNSLGDNGTRKGGAQKIFALIDSACLDGGEHIFLHKFLVQILDIELGSAGGDRLFLQAVQLGALSHIAGNSDDLAVVIVFFQPRNDNGGVQTAGIGENDLFDFFVCHDDSSNSF